MKKIVVILICAGALFVQGRLADDKSTVMAKYLVSISRYIQWPGSSGSGNFKVGVLGDFNIYRAIAEETMGSGIQNRNVDVINIPRLESIKMTNFNILVLSGNYASPANLEKVLKMLANTPTVIITERSGALKDGASINFVDANDRYSFEIDKSNTQRNGILVSRQIDVFASKVVD